MHDALAFFDREARQHPEDAVPMRHLAARLLADGLLSGFVLVPWDHQSFGILRSAGGGWERRPCIGVWLDTTDPLFWVQVRECLAGDTLACHQPLGVEEAMASVAALLPQLAALADRGCEDAEPRAAPDTGRT